jgi:hypothetical protein
VRQLQPSLLGAEEPALSSCTCKAACSLRPFLETAQMEAGDGVLSVCFKGQLFFADVLADGRLRAASADGPITLDHPCALVRLVRASLGSTATAPVANPLKLLHYKGNSLDSLRKPPPVQRTASRGAKRGRDDGDDGAPPPAELRNSHRPGSPPWKI